MGSSEEQSGDSIWSSTLCLVSMGSSFADHSLAPHGVNASFHAAERLSATTNGSPAQTLLLALLLLQHHGNDSYFQGYRDEASAQGCMWSTCASQCSSLPKAVLQLSQLQATAEEGQLHSWGSGARIRTASVKRPDQKAEL